MSSGSRKRQEDNGRARRATIEDVARAAEVSVATVSRAVRGLPNVAPSTRRRVLAVASRLDYRADPNASRLASGRSFTGAIAIPMLNTWYFSQVIAGAEAVFSDAGYDLLLIAVDGRNRRGPVVNHLNQFARRVDGLIVVDFRPDDEELTELESADIAVVTIGQQTAQFPSITNDERAAAAAAVEHLIGLGHVAIGYIGGFPDDQFNFRVAHERYLGYRDAMSAAGLTVEPQWETAGDFSIEGAKEAMAQLLDHPEPPTSVFAISDEMAMAATAVCHQAGLGVPHDMSMVGFDDHELSSVMELTTVRQRPVDNGAAGARLLVSMMHDPDAVPLPLVSETELVVRSTSASPRRTRRLRSSGLVPTPSQVEALHASK